MHVITSICMHVCKLLVYCMDTMLLINGYKLFVELYKIRESYQTYESSKNRNYDISQEHAEAHLGHTYNGDNYMSMN